jgi:hypothetical protein
MVSSDRPDRGHDELEAIIIRRAQERLARSPYAALGRVATPINRARWSSREACRRTTSSRSPRRS